MDVKQLISDFSIGEKIELYNCLYTDLSGKGLGGDTELAHVNPEEMAVLRAMGGAGTVNPNTNLIQFTGGGGSSAPPAPAVQTQVQQSEFPTELKPFIQDIFGKAQAIQENKEAEGFQAFQGPLQAEFDPAQTKSFEQIEALPGATQPLFDDATRLARSASGPLPTAEELQAASNPFVRNVIDIQKREAERVSDVQGQKQDAAAAQAGAFGGSRAAILEAERQRNLNQELGDIELQGQLAAFQDAQQRIAQQRGREASGATQLAALGSAIPAQQLKELGALSGVGAARQTQAQRGIDLARQEFEAEEAFPSQTLQEFSSVLRGFPLAPTRSVREQQFSAAQPLSTQLLGVGTQALGALGASGALKGAFGQAGGQVGRMPVKKYQGGGALNSLINNTEGLDTQPVIGMAGGGGFKGMMSFLSPAYGVGRAAKKGGLKGLMTHLSPAFAMSQGKMPMGLDNLMGGGGPDAPPPPSIPAASTVLSPEELAKQKDAVLRAQATRGQQAASAGAPRGQAFSQTGNQVRQPFKHGGGLRQMVNLPSNRVQFGKTAYQDVTEEEGFFARLFDPRRTHVETFQGKPIKNIPHGLQNQELNMGLPRNNPIGGRFDTPIFDMKQLISEAPAALGGDKVQVEEAAELDIAPAPKAPASKPKASDTPAPKPTAEEVKLYRDPEEAAYASLIDSQAGQNAAKRYFAGENVGLANISEALKAYKGFKDTEMGQRQKINEANLKKAAAARATRSATLKDAETLSQIAMNRDAPAIERMKAAQKGIDSVQDTLVALGESGKQAFQNAPESPLGQQYAKALRRGQAFAKVLESHAVETAQSRLLGQGATGQAIQGETPETQAMIANILEQYKQG
jgi:hypothetical protein